MIEVLGVPAYRKLFSAQIVALLGTGLLTVALGLLAFDLASGQATVWLQTALTIKMLAYVFIAPVMAALVEWLPKRAVLVAADPVRAGIALMLPMVDQAWQVNVLVFILLLLMLTDYSLEKVLFESISAFATVGMSTGITYNLPPSAEWVLMALMFTGRIGTVTVASALALSSRPRLYRLPEERPIIG